MRTKKVHMELKRLDDTLKEAGEMYNSLARGEGAKIKKAIYFSSPKDLRAALTEKRLELLKTVKEQEPTSLYELAKLVKRNLKNVLQDVAYLQRLGLMDVTEGEERKVPRVRYDAIALEVTL